ncbi:MAG: hypothetical protein MUP98_07010 [Candidatus Aminicenantes bacterium]|nr:hypothetical protein [Candidatus Aminicenantes bacterium]
MKPKTDSAGEFKMRIKGLVCCLLLAGILGRAEEKSIPSGGFDFSAIDRLWDIVSVLEKDQEPLEAAWEALVRTPGYAALISNEWSYNLDFLKRNLRLVFKPSLSSELEKNSQNRAVRHFLELKEKKTALQEFQVQMQESTALTETLDLLKGRIPEEATKRLDIPPSAFIVFDKDARGGYGLLLFDLLYALELGDLFKPLYAHEAFHYYRDKLAAFSEGDILLVHQGILLALNMIQNEGLADLIDKPKSIFEGGPRADSSYALEYRKNMAESPRILGTLDELLCSLADIPGALDEVIGWKMFEAIPQSGHPTGFFMAKAVSEKIGEEDLIRTFNNPFAFFYLYNAAAATDPTLPRVSNKAIAALFELERKYIDRPERDLADAALAEGFDFSAVDLFQKVTGILEKNKEPDPMLWEMFFRNVGYGVLFSAEPNYSREALEDVITLVFKPSREEELKSAMRKGAGRSLEYFMRYKTDLETISKSVLQLRKTSVFNVTLEKVQTLLPQEVVQGLFRPTVHFIYFSKDLRYGYSAMLVDPMYYHDRPDSLPYFLRCFILKAYKDRICFYDKNALTQRQATFVQGWDRIQLLGLADLLSHEKGAGGVPARRNYEEELKNVPRLLGEADRLLAQADGDPSVWKEFQALMNEFEIRPGCPAGFVMTSTVKEIFGLEALAETAGNSLAFIRLYQEAAIKKGNLPVFSDEAIGFISHLEKEIKPAPGK